MRNLMILASLTLALLLSGSAEAKKVKEEVQLPVPPPVHQPCETEGMYELDAYNYVYGDSSIMVSFYRDSHDFEINCLLVRDRISKKRVLPDPYVIRGAIGLETVTENKGLWVFTFSLTYEESQARGYRAVAIPFNPKTMLFLAEKGIATWSAYDHSVDIQTGQSL